MAKMLADGNTKVTFAPTVASIAAPDVDELTGGTTLDLQCFITADGLSISVDEAVVSLPALCETFNAESPGRATYAIDLTFYRHVADADDDAWNTIQRLVSGYLAIRYGTAHGTAWAASDRAIVFPVTFGERKPQPTEANGGVTFQVRAYVTSQPELDAVVVAA